MTLAVTYDDALHLAGIGLAVWSRLGPEQWFPQYKILCGNVFDYDANFVLTEPTPAVRAATSTPGLLATPPFPKIVAGLRDYYFLTYKPFTRLPLEMSGRLVMNDPALARFENKRVFRELFADKLPIPEYQILPFDELNREGAAAAYRRFAAQFGPVFVLQHEHMSGGRGTFIVRSAADVTAACKVLGLHPVAIIISRFIKGIERSRQAFVSKTAFVPGPLQQQLVRHPELVDIHTPNVVQFCGAQIVSAESEAVQEQIDHAQNVIAEELRAAGYRGIFGTDFLVGDDGHVYTLEINARTTGVLPLLNEQQSPLPLYLLHILELSGQPYNITGSPALPPAGTGPQAFVLLSNLASTEAYFDNAVTTGNYRLHDGRLQRLDHAPHWNDAADCLVQLWCTPDTPAKPGARLCALFCRSAAFDDAGQLTPDARQVLAAVKAHLITAA